MRFRSEACRVAGLDILRAIAIFWVLLSHCSVTYAAWAGRQCPWPIAAAGFYGVELFFVLSGFLIGRLLIDLLGRGGGIRAWAVFMVRRWLRTLPLYYFCLLVLVAVWPPVFWQPGHAALWRDLPWFLTFTQSLAWPTPDGWFSAAWSLAVEEWFYLAFSALLLSSAAWFGSRAALALSLGLFLAVPLILRAALPASVDWGEITSKVTPLRLDSMATGVLMAWLFISSSQVRALSTPLLAIGMLVIVFVWSDGLHHVLHMPTPIWKAMIFDAVSIGFVLCLPSAALCADTWNWLDQPARALSRQSYSLYLFHLPILEMASFYRPRIGISPGLCMVLCIALMAALSHASYRYLERPILARRPPQ